MFLLILISIEWIYQKQSYAHLVNQLQNGRHTNGPTMAVNAERWILSEIPDNAPEFPDEFHENEALLISIKFFEESKCWRDDCETMSRQYPVPPLLLARGL